jgi:hypothetical protein
MDVIKLTGDRNEVRDEVEGKREVADKREEEHLSLAGHARVTHQPAYEHDAVRYERCERSRILAAPATINHATNPPKTIRVDARATRRHSHQFTAPD